MKISEISPEDCTDGDKTVLGDLSDGVKIGRVCWNGFGITFSVSRWYGIGLACDDTGTPTSGDGVLESSDIFDNWADDFLACPFGVPVPPLRFRLLISSSVCFFALTVIILLTTSWRYLSSFLIRERRVFNIGIRSIAAFVASSYRGLDQDNEHNSNSFVISSNYSQ